MLALFIAVLAAAWLVSAADFRYTVHGSVVFHRVGEHTPALGRDSMTLTSLGAQQLYESGQAFRERYIQPLTSDNNFSIPAPILGLSPYVVDPNQLYILSPDWQFASASAQAFLQGLYPPHTIGKDAAPVLDPTNLLANSTYVEYPLDGYQYAQIHTASYMDPNSIYLDGTGNCGNWALSSTRYLSSAEFAIKESESIPLYRSIGQTTLFGVLPEGAWGYVNSIPINEYVQYQYLHNTTINSILDADAMGNSLQQVRWLADQYAWMQNGDLTVSGPTNGDQIRAVAGRTLAAKILGLLLMNIQSSGQDSKLNLLFGDYEPFLAFFALAKVGQLGQNGNFKGLPRYGSAMVFELFSYDGASSDVYPHEDDLWVRWYFRNGSTVVGSLEEDANGGNASMNTDLQSYPLFGRGPSETDLPWSDFRDQLESFMLSDVGEWCNMCGTPTMFCGAFNASYSLNPGSGGNAGNTSGGGMSNQVAGVIGAAATLGALVLLTAAAMLLGGVRFHRVQSRRKSELGGFKGGRKMASDADLTIPKSGAGATVEEVKGRERVGSWELKDVEAARFGTLSPPPRAREMRESMETERAVNPFEDPVKPTEHV